MASLADLLVKVGIDASGLTAGLKSVSDDFKALDKEARGIEKSLAGFTKVGDRLTSIGTGLTAGLTLPIVGAGAAAIHVAGQMEVATIAFEGLLGSAQKAKTFLDSLKAFAATTPFEFPELVQASKRMLALGFEATQVIPVLRIVGDTAAGLGAGAEGVNRIILALGQMQAKGKVSAQEMNQLAEVGVRAWQLLADKIGVSIPEAMKLAEKGAIQASVAVPAILEGMNQQFSGQMERQSKTLQGQWSNFKDQVTLILADIGVPLLEVAKTVLEASKPVLAMIQAMAQGFAQLPAPVQTVVVGMFALAAAAGPVLIVVGQMLASVPALSAIIGVLGGVSIAGLVVALKVAAVAVLALGLAFAAWKFQDYIPGIILLKGYIELLTKWFGFLFDQIKRLPVVGQAFQKLEAGAKGVKSQFDQNMKGLAELQKKLGDLGKSTIDLTAEKKRFQDMLFGTTDAAKKNAKAMEELTGRVERHNAAVSNARDYKLFDKAITSANAAAKATGLFSEEFDLLGIAAAAADKDVSKLGDSTLPALALGVDASITKQRELIESFKRLGITSTAELSSMAEANRIAYGRISADAGSSTRDVIAAWVKYQESAIAAARAAGETIPKEQLASLERMKAQLGEKLPEQEKRWDTFSKSVSTIITNFAQDISRSLWDGDISWGEKGKQLLKSLGQAVSSMFIEPATAAIGKFITGVLSDLLGGKGFGGILDGLKSIGSAIAGIFGGGGGITGVLGGGTQAAADVSGAVGDIVGAGGSAANTAAGVAGQAAGMGMSAVAGIVTGAVSAVSSVIGNFQMAGMNKSLDLIEKEVRYSQIHLQEILEKGVNLFLAELPGIREIVGAFQDNHAWRIHDVWERLGELVDVVRFDTNPTLWGIQQALVTGPPTVNLIIEGNADRETIDYAIEQISRNLR